MVGPIQIPDLIEEDQTGIFADHPIRAVLPVILAPTSLDRSEARNTIRREAVVVACANLKEHNFAFDSSVLEQGSRDGFANLARLILRRRGAPMSLFGHADPSGNDTYNKVLSERRARSVFAVMVRDVGIWERLDDNTEGASGDTWGLRAVQHMLAALGHEPGNQDGKPDQATAEAIGAAVGSPGPAPLTKGNRRIIFERYMDFLRTPDPEKGPPFPVLTDDDFLGTGTNPGSVQGCSEFNPQLLLSRTEHKDFATTGADGKERRDKEHRPNRRIVIFFFAPGTTIDEKKWPCPSAKQGIGGCIKRFWSDGDKRRGLDVPTQTSMGFDEHRRRFGKSVHPPFRKLTPSNPDLAQRLGEEETTFGCRFYHGLALHSPCERDVKFWVVQLLRDGPNVDTPGRPPERNLVPVANRSFVATIGDSPDAPVIRGNTTASGMIGLPLFDEDVDFTIKIDTFAPDETPPPDEPKTETLDSEAFAGEQGFFVVKVAGSALRRIAPRSQGPGFDPDFDLDDPGPDAEERRLAALQRLYNLGFGNDDPKADFSGWTPADRSAAVAAFQRANPPLEVNGNVDDSATQEQIRKEHGS